MIAESKRTDSYKSDNLIAISLSLQLSGVLINMESLKL